MIAKVTVIMTAVRWRCWRLSSTRLRRH